MTTTPHRLGRTALLALLCAIAPLPGCGAARVPHTSHVPAPQFTLVRRGAWLHEHADAKSAAARDPLFAEKPYQTGRAATMEVIRREEDWVAVRPVIRPVKSTPTERKQRPCVSTLYSLRHLDIVVWVRARDLVPAARVETGYRYADGTSITLRAGAPIRFRSRLRRTGHSLYNTRPGRFRFNTVLADVDVGLFWRASPAFDNAPSSERLITKAEMRFGHTARVLDTNRWSPLYVQDRRAVKAGELVTVRSRCAELRVLVKPDDIRGLDQAAEGLGALMGAAGRGDKAAMVVPAGTQLTWRSGVVAGVTHAVMRPRQEVAIADDLRRCFRWSLRTYWGKRRERQSEADFVLCAPRAHVR